jgi:hypothetical protein
MQHQTLLLPVGDFRVGTVETQQGIHQVNSSQKVVLAPCIERDRNGLNQTPNKPKALENFHNALGDAKQLCVLETDDIGDLQGNFAINDQPKIVAQNIGAYPTELS